MTTPRLEMRGVEKRFGGATALAGVDFAVLPGEIHGLVGPNGAGKSTLIKIAAGVLRPDAGDLRWNGASASFRDAHAARRAGVAVIHQELALAPNLSVAENLFLGREPAFGGWLRRRAMFANAERALARLHMTEVGDVRTPVDRLSTARRQLVEIARALAQDSQLLILDEPTSSLSKEEVENLFDTLRRLAAHGASLAFVSHRLDELLALTDRITLLRDGRSEGTKATRELTAKSLAEWIAGTDSDRAAARKSSPKSPNDRPALQVHRLTSRKLRGVDLTIAPREIVGLVGRLGSGRSSLLRTIFGVERPISGTIEIAGRSLRLGSPRASRNAGLAFAPEDRKRCGLVVDDSVSFNLALPWTDEWIVGPFVRRGVRRRIVHEGVESFRVKTASVHSPVRALSGGNQQKVVLAKAMHRPPSVYLLDEPTRGIDVAARSEIHAELRALAADGMAILLASSEFDEILALADRLLFIHEGAIVDERSADGATESRLAARLAELAG